MKFSSNFNAIAATFFGALLFTSLLVDFSVNALVLDANKVSKQSIRTFRLKTTNLHVAAGFDENNQNSEVFESLRRAVNNFCSTAQAASLVNTNVVKMDFLQRITADLNCISAEVNSAISCKCSMKSSAKKEEDTLIDLNARKHCLDKELTYLQSFLMESPLAARMLTWPRGYAGDFETVDYIVQGKNTANDGGIGWYINEIMLHHPLCEQHRNKMDAQAQLVAKYLQKNNNLKKTTKVLSLACNANADIRKIKNVMDESDCHITLVDQDSDAIDFARSQLQSLVENNKCTFITGNVLRLHRGSLVERPPEGYDTVLAGGLFDYLSDKMIVRKLKYIWNELLAPDGSIFFANIDEGFNERYNVEHIFNWPLIERSQSQLIDLCKEAGIPQEYVVTETEKSGSTIMVTVTKPN